MESGRIASLLCALGFGCSSNILVRPLLQLRYYIILPPSSSVRVFRVVEQQQGRVSRGWDADMTTTTVMMTMIFLHGVRPARRSWTKGGWNERPFWSVFFLNNEVECQVEIQVWGFLV